MVSAENLVRSHDPRDCAGRHCCLHNPSDHPLRDAPLHFRKRDGLLAERICEHGCGHPDPDHLALTHLPHLDINPVHGCDGCCN